MDYKPMRMTLLAGFSMSFDLGKQYNKITIFNHGVKGSTADNVYYSVDKLVWFDAPDAILLPPQMAHTFKQVARIVYVFSEGTPLVQVIGS